MIIGDSVFKDFAKKDGIYGLFVEDLLNSSNATRLFDTLGKIMQKKE
jgi:hypothetical protein